VPHEPQDSASYRPPADPCCSLSALGVLRSLPRPMCDTDEGSGAR
jgi:hypothetical protein